MKLCKDCNYFRMNTSVYDLKPASAYDPKCAHPTSATSQDMVFGYVTHYTCKAMRESSKATACGENAQYYDPIRIFPCAKPE